jgi:hypothetical protein
MPPAPSNSLSVSLADAIVESKGGVTELPYTKDQGEEATMKDAIRVADIINEQRKAAIRAQRKEREEKFAKMQADRQSCPLCRHEKWCRNSTPAAAPVAPAATPAAAPVKESK